MITEEKLMAYADGELSREERTLIESALENEQLQRRLTEEWRLRRTLLALYDPALDEPVPERLTRFLEASASPAPPRTKDASPGRHTWWGQVTAIAATLAFGIFVGHGLAVNPPLTGSGTARLADRELAQALNVQLASTQSRDAPVQVGISFTDEEGSPCRSFRSAEVVGLACRDAGQWALKLMAPIERSSSFEYQQAGSATALVMKSAQEMMFGEPMDATEERRARDSGWTPVQGRTESQ